MTNSHQVYCCLDRSGAVIYVGMTYRLRQRMGEHRRGSAWWTDVVTTKVLGSYTDRDEAINVERRAIRDLLPRHNKYRHRDMVITPGRRAIAQLPVSRTRIPRPHTWKRLAGLYSTAHGSAVSA